MGHPETTVAVDDVPLDRRSLAEYLARLEPLSEPESEPRALERIGRVFVAALRVDTVSIYLYDHGLTRIVAAGHVGLSDMEVAAYDAVLSLSPYDVPIERAVIEHGGPVQRTTPDDFARYPDINPTGSTEPYVDIVIPLQFGERPLGVAYLRRRGNHQPLPPDAVDVAVVLARHASLGLQAARAVRRVHALAGIGRALADVPDLDALVGSVMATLRSAVPCDAAALVLRDDGDADGVVVWTSFGDRLERRSWEAITGLAERVLRQGEFVAAGRAAGRAGGEDDPLLGALAGFPTVVHAPLQAGGEAFGVLSVGVASNDAFSPADLEIVETVAAQTAVAVANARALTAANERLARLALLNRVSEAINASLEVASICAALDLELSGVFRADALLVGIAPVEGQATDEREIGIAYQRDPDGMFGAGLAESLRSMIWYALHAGEPVVVSDAAAVRGVLGGHNAGSSALAGSVAILPMRTGDVAIGAVCLASHAERAWTQEQVRVLATVARSTALAIENARLYAEVAHERVRIGQLAVWQHALLEGGRIITQGSDMHSMLDAVARQLEQLLAHDGLAIYTLDPESSRLVTTMVRSKGQVLPVGWELPRGQGLGWAAVEAAAPLLVNNAHLDPRAYYPAGDPVDPSQGEHEIVVPLIVDGRTIGTVCLSRQGPRPFSEHEFEVFAAFVPHLAIALQSAQHVERSRAVHISTIRALTAVIDTKDPLSAGHSERVGEISRRLAARLGVSAAEQRTIELAGLLHDIGKVGIPDEILAKAGPLTDDQRMVMRAHPVLGADILRATGAPELAPLIPLVRHHHEFYDGSGYPDGLRGDATPFGAAVIAVADAFDMLTNERFDRPALSPADALAEIRRNAGRQFHPAVVDALAVLVHDGADIDASHPLREREEQPSQGGGQRAEIRSIAALHRISSEISRISDLDAFLESAVRIISEELEYDNVDLLLPSDSGAHFIVRARVAAPERVGRDWLVPADQGIIGEVARVGRPVIVEEPIPAIAVPLTVEGAIVGIVSVESGRQRAFDALDERNLTVIAAQLAPAVELARVHDQMKRAAQRDGLTGIYNHASFYARLEEALGGDEPVAVMIFDVEGLKRINDTAGHLAGDHVLRRIAVALELETRPDDLVARYGGDEFAVIVTGVNAEQAEGMARRLQAAVNRLTWGVANEPLSISVGVAVALPGASKAAEVVALADQRMYETRRHERAPRPAPRREERRRSGRSASLNRND